MSNETKCQNSGCGQYVKGLAGNCQLFKVSAYKSNCFTTHPHESIPTAELAELRADREMLDWVLLECDIHVHGDSFMVNLIPTREAITKAMKEPT